MAKKQKADDKKTVKKKKLQPSVLPEATKTTHEDSSHTVNKAEKLQADAKEFATSTAKKAKEFTQDAEHKIEEVTQKAKTYISGKWKEDLEEFKNETGEKLERVATGVEHMAEWYEDIVESIFPNDHTWSKITYVAEWKEDVNRLVIVRMLWSILLVPVMAVWWAWIALVWIVFMIKIITTWKRDRILWNKMIRFANYVLNWDAYMWGLIDRRPEIVE